MQNLEEVAKTIHKYLDQPNLANADRGFAD